jgi:hypothetical protein
MSQALTNPALLPLIATGALAAAALLLITAWRPPLGCIVLALAIPLTGGIPRGTLVPLLRINEALLLIVAAGVLIHELPRRRQLTFTGLDLIVVAYCLGGVLVPWAVLKLTAVDTTTDTWFNVLAPAQYLVVYLVFSRVDFSDRNLRLLVNVTLLSSVIVALVALAELLNAPGVRQFIASYYPPPPPAPGDTSTVYRPTSLLGHFSAVGAFGLFNMTLALALAAARDRAFPSIWLAVVMALNAVGMLITETFAPLLAAPLVVVIIVLYARHIPWQLGLAPPAFLAAVIAFWPTVSARLLEQRGVRGSLIPESMQVRIGYWQDFFLPSLLNHHAWLGTGTLIPSDVPGPLDSFVDNGYLWMAYRAGAPGVILMLLLLGGIAVAGLSLRTSRDPWHIALGATCVAMVVSVALMEVTSEYLTFTSLTQEFWMLAGLLTAAVTQRRPAPTTFVALSAAPPGRVGRGLPVR